MTERRNGIAKALTRQRDNQLLDLLLGLFWLVPVVVLIVAFNVWLGLGLGAVGLGLYLCALHSRDQARKRRRR